jgi:hypothetical protein
MKTIQLILALVLFSSIDILAQQKDYKGHIINSKGDIYFNGEKVGLITKEQIIKDADGKKIGFLNAEGSLSDENGKKIGKLGKDGGNFYNTNNVLVLSVKDNPDETCNILDAKGKVIGNVHDSYKGIACSIHCFQSKMKKNPNGSHMKH